MISDLEADFYLELELNDLKTKNGKFDELIVLRIMQEGVSGNKAITIYNTLKPYLKERYR